MNKFFIIRILAVFAVLFCCNGIRAQHISGNNIDSSKGISGIISDSSNNLKVEYLLSQYSEIEKKYIDVRHETIINPRKSALVIIDIWEEKILDYKTINFINPLIKELNGLGMKIIYAPSINEQNSNLLVIDSGVIFYNNDIMDEYLYDNKIENLFYVGFDTYYCVLDKPNGIFSYYLRDYDKNIKIFLFEEGVISFTREMKKAAISLLKSNGVGIIKSNQAEDSEVFSMETIEDSLIYTAEQIEPGNNFVVIYKNDFVNKALNDFEDSLKENNINFGVVYNNKLIYKDRKILHLYEFIRLLIQLKINNIYYAGYYVNNEILWSEFGITPLYIKKMNYGIEKLPTIYIVNDLSYIVPSAKIGSEIEKAVVINHYRNMRNILSATLLNELKNEVKISDNKYYLLFRDLKTNMKAAIKRSLKSNDFEIRKVKTLFYIFSLFFVISFFIFVFRKRIFKHYFDK